MRISHSSASCWTPMSLLARSSQLSSTFLFSVCRTVCILVARVQSFLDPSYIRIYHCPSQGLFWPCKKYLSPIFFARICVTSALNRFGIPLWMWGTALDGSGTGRRRSFLFFSSFHSAIHLSCTFCRIIWLLAECSRAIYTAGAVDLVSTSITLPFLFFFLLHPVIIWLQYLPLCCLTLLCALISSIVQPFLALLDRLLSTLCRLEWTDPTASLNF